MSDLIVMVGIAGSGKSTLAERFVKLFSNYTIVSSDAIRQELYGDASIQKDPVKVFEIAHSQLDRRISLGQNVIFDATNLNAKFRKEVLDIANKYPNVRKIACVVTTPVETCIKRQEKRARKVPNGVIRRQSLQMEMPQKAEGFDEIWISSDT